MPVGLVLGLWVLLVECCQVLWLFLPLIALVLVPESLVVVLLVLLRLRFLGRELVRRRNL